MRRYLATLHKKSDAHKKRFAFLASFSFTLFVFIVWSFVNFGFPGQISKDNSGNELVAMGDVRVQDKSLSLDPLKNGVAAAWQAIGGTLEDAKAELQQVDLNSEYEDMKGRAIETYGRQR